MKKLILFFALITSSAITQAQCWPPTNFNIAEDSITGDFTLSWDNQIGDTLITWGHIQWMTSPVIPADSLVLSAYYVGQVQPYTYTLAYQYTLNGLTESVVLPRAAVCEHETDWGVDAYCNGVRSHPLYFTDPATGDTIRGYNWGAAVWGCAVIAHTVSNITATGNNLTWTGANRVYVQRYYYLRGLPHAQAMFQVTGNSFHDTSIRFDGMYRWAVSTNPHVWNQFSNSQEVITGNRLPILHRHSQIETLSGN